MATTEIMARMGLDTAKFDRGINKAKGALGGLKSAIGSMGMVLSTGALVGFAKSAINAGSAITDMALATNTGIEEIQALNFAAQEAGAGQEQMANLLVRVQKSAADAARGLSTAKDAFALLGINAEEFLKLPNERKLEEIGKALVRTNGDTRAYGAALDLLGSRNAPKLMEVLQQLGTNGFDYIAKKARDAGQIMSEETARAMDETADNIERHITRLRNSFSELLGLMGDAGTAAGTVVYGTEADMDMEFARQQAIDELMKEFKGDPRGKLSGLKKLMNPTADAREQFEKSELGQLVEARALAILAKQEAKQKTVEDARDKQAEAEKDAADAAAEAMRAEEERQKALKWQSKTITEKIKTLTDGISKAVEYAKEQLQRQDSGKLTLGELSRLKTSSFGTSFEAGDAGAQARELMSLREKADAARQAGNLTGFESFDQYNQEAQGLEKKLFDSGFLKSSEVSPETLDAAANEESKQQRAAIQKEIATSNTKLEEIVKNTAGGDSYK